MTESIYNIFSKLKLGELKYLKRIGVIVIQFMGMRYHGKHIR